MSASIGFDLQADHKNRIRKHLLWKARRGPSFVFDVYGREFDFRLYEREFIFGVQANNPSSSCRQDKSLTRKRLDFLFNLFRRNSCLNNRRQAMIRRLSDSDEQLVTWLVGELNPLSDSEEWFGHSYCQTASDCIREVDAVNDSDQISLETDVKLKATPSDRKLHHIIERYHGARRRTKLRLLLKNTFIRIAERRFPEKRQANRIIKAMIDFNKALSAHDRELGLRLGLLISFEVAVSPTDSSLFVLFRSRGEEIHT